MDWMYKGVSGLVDREEYLKGRKIDKTFEIIEKEENKAKGDFDSLDSQIPQSVFDSNYNKSSSETVTVDLATKLREDPLYEIRLKQKEQRRKLLDNPLKLKKLKNILESTLSEQKHDKHKKSKRRDSRERERHRDKSPDNRYSNRDHRQKSDRDSGYRESGRNRYKSAEPSRHRDKDRETKSYNDRDRHRNDDKKYEHNNRSSDKRRDDYAKYSSRSHHSKPKSNKPSEEELERRRSEMMDNAVWRETNRKSNVKSYNEEELEESKFNESAKSAQFIKPLLKRVTETDSLEDRIKQRRFTSQRSYNSMDTNFAKK